ncbi:hypothetical protein EPH_0065190 [Eimeria praecox]|uniref:Transmembrane protein n=1 Tax=Eimeria praecox TaxID=51316 RepID=U6GZU5_9EIME|nr:hypothetical protein EPH_0065190 [Eimeria praecox]
MEAGHLKFDSSSEALEKWRAQASGSALHATAKRRFRRVHRNLQLATLLPVAALTVAFMLLRCYLQLAVLSIPGKGPLRSLAEEEGAGRETRCWGAHLEGSQSLVGGSDSIELAVQQQTEDVVRKMVQTVRGGLPVAALLPSRYSMLAIDLFLGLCIQEVAALESLLGKAFKDGKAEVLETVIKEASKALELIEAAISSSKPNRARKLIDEEAAYSLIQEMKRLIYTRRDQVFRSNHLSHFLRGLEEKRARGKLTDPLNIRLLEEEPEQTLEEKLDNLVTGALWVNVPFRRPQASLQQSSPQKEGTPAKEDKSQSMQSPPNLSTSSRCRRRGFNVPPRLAGKDDISGRSTHEKGTHQTQTKPHSSHPETSRQMLGGFYPSHKAKPLQASHATSHQAPSITYPPRPPFPKLETAGSKQTQAPSITYPPRPPFPKLETAGSKQTLGPTGPTPPWSGRSSSGLASTSSLDARPQPTVPAEEEKETLEASGPRRQTEMRFGVPKEAPTWPWSSTWSPYSPLLPGPHQAFGRPAYMAGTVEGASSHQPGPHQAFGRPAYMAGTVEGASSHQAPPNQVGQVWTPISQYSSPSSSFPFTNPQSIAAEAAALLYSSGSQSPPAESTLAASSGSTLSSLVKGQTVQPMGFPSYSAPSRRPADLHSVEQGVGGSNDSMQGPSGPRSAESSLLGVQMQEQHQDVLEESPWLDSDSDSG